MLNNQRVSHQYLMMPVDIPLNHIKPPFSMEETSTTPLIICNQRVKPLDPLNHDKSYEKSYEIIIDMNIPNDP